MWTAEQGLWGILLPVEKKARFGGGSWRSLAAVREGNVRPL